MHRLRPVCAVAWALMEDLLERGALKQSMLPVCNTVLEVGRVEWVLWVGWRWCVLVLVVCHNDRWGMSRVV